jgi:NAD(P)-dependent dehydrogenase (short-subunit alcohol dehydrogenase family)
MTQTLHGRVALVTSGSSSLGFASARALAQQGHRSPSRAAGGESWKRRRPAGGRGGRGRTFAADVRDAASRAAWSSASGALGPHRHPGRQWWWPPSKPASQAGRGTGDRHPPGPPSSSPPLPPGPPGPGRRWGRIAASTLSRHGRSPTWRSQGVLSPAVIGCSDPVAGGGGGRRDRNAVLPGYTRTERQEELASRVSHRQADRGSRRRLGRQRADRPPGRSQESAPRRLPRLPMPSFVTGQARRSTAATSAACCDHRPASSVRSSLAAARETTPATEQWAIRR